MTLAAVEVEYTCATPGVKAPNEAGAPRVSESVAGTVPLTVSSATSVSVTALPA